MSKSQNMMTGEAGRYRVAAELLLRGVQVLFPAIDDGIDLATTQGFHIQVKTARKNQQGHYHFNFKSWRIANGKRIQVRGLHPDVTHVVLWGVDEDLLWIFPTTQFSKKKMQICLGGKNGKWTRISHPFRSYFNAWHYLCRKRGD